MRDFAFCFQGTLFIWIQEIKSYAEIRLLELSCQLMQHFLRDNHDDRRIYGVCFCFLQNNFCAHQLARKLIFKNPQLSWAFAVLSLTSGSSSMPLFTNQNNRVPKTLWIKPRIKGHIVIQNKICSIYQVKLNVQLTIARLQHNILHHNF